MIQSKQMINYSVVAEITVNTCSQITLESYKMENPLNNLVMNITDHFVKSRSREGVGNYGKVLTLIRIHSEKLSQIGDVSFPCKTEIWLKYFPCANGLLNEEAFQLSCGNNEKVEKEKQKLVEVSQQWLFPIQDLHVRQERCHLHLQRNALIQYLIPMVMQNSKYGVLKKATIKQVYLNALLEQQLEKQDLTFYRSQLLYNVLQRLLQYSSWNVLENKPDCPNQNDRLELNVCSVVTKCPNNIYNGITIKTGLVIDPSNNGKLCQLTTQEYLSIRTDDMTLMALHKYGIRVKQDARFCALMKRIGCAAATVDLLEVKHTSPVHIIRNGQGSTRGASFILYNSARLETILRTFQERIDLGEYEPLPSIDNIQWELLREEEEWQMVYVYLAGFPDLIQRCLEQLERGLCSTHLIIRFLHGLVNIFSVYYRRIKILTEKRDHIMPYVYARIYLIKAVREILNKTLALLDIEPVEFM